jgi:hypothetical protein
MPIEFHDITDESRAQYTRWLATMTKQQVKDYADRKMMDRGYMLRSWKAARKRLRKREPKS